MRVWTAVLVMAGCGACPGEIASDERVLAEIAAAGGRSVKIDAHHGGQRVLTRGGMADRFSVRHTFRVARGGADERVFYFDERSPARPAWAPGAGAPDAEAGRAMLARLTVDHCARGEDVVWRVSDPQPGSTYPRLWEILYVRPGAVVHDTFASDASSCEAARRDAPDLDTTIARMRRRPGGEACRVLDAVGRPADAAQCRLVRALIEPGDRERFAEARRAVQAGGTEEAEFYALLAASEPIADDGEPDARTVTDLVAAAPDAAQRARWIAETVSRCADPTYCRRWRVRAIAQLDRTQCDPLLGHAAAWLAQADAGLEVGEAALGLLLATSDCGTDEQRARVARRALERRSLAAEVVRQRGSADDLAWGACTHQNVAAGNPNLACRSLPRWAGSWLGLHCDLAGDAIATARRIAAASPRAVDERHDDVLDGALRVLAHCAPNETIERAR